MKLTQQQIDEIKKLYKEENRIIDIAKQFKISSATVIYHVNDEYNKKHREQGVQNFRKKSFKERQAIYKKRLVYIREYKRKWRKKQI